MTLHAAAQAGERSAGSNREVGLSSGNLAHIEMPAPFADRYEEAMSWARIYAENAADMLRTGQGSPAAMERASLYAQVSMALSNAFRRPA